MAQLSAPPAGWLARVGRVGRLLLLLLLLAPPAGQALEGVLNLNTASREQLQTLPFIGAARAKAIIDYRNRHRPLVSLDQLLDSKAIGASTLEAIKPYLTLTGPSTLRRTSGPEPPAGPGRASDFHLERHISIRPDQVKILADQEYYPALLQFIGQAKRRIDMAMFLFKITKARHNRPAAIAKALIAARKRGVRIRLLLENSGYDATINQENRRVARLLRTNRIQVRFDSARTTTHAKLVVIDQRFVFSGSHNLTHSALSRNHEFSLLFDSPVLARQAIAYLNGIH